MDCKWFPVTKKQKGRKSFRVIVNPTMVRSATRQMDSSVVKDVVKKCVAEDLLPRPEDINPTVRSSRNAQKGKKDFEDCISAATPRSMACANSPFFISFLILLIALATIFTSLPYTLGLESGSERRRDEIGGRRILLSFRETPEGGNVTYECSPSGPCVPCAYSEKNDERYRCSETGYRIPFKCVEIKEGSRGKNSKKSQNSRLTIENVDALLHDAEVTTPVRHGRLLDDSSTFEGGTQAYITYRSCIPAVNEEKLSILGFEGIIMFLLLISGSVIYLRQKRTVALRIGAVRIQTNSSLFIT